MKPIDPLKREQIIRAAIDVFLKKGFDNATVQEITQAADVAKGTMYTHFRSKDHLIRQVFEYCHMHDIEACDKGLDAVDDILDKLCLRMENGIRWAIECMDEATIERMYLNSAERIPANGAHYAQQGHFVSVDPILRSGIAQGVLKPLPPTLLGEVFFGVASAFYFYFSSSPALFEDAALRQQCRDAVVDAIAVKPRANP